jgi:uncharacterized protein YutD
VIHGTLRNSDLLEAFSDCLRELDKEEKFKEILERVDYITGQYSEDEINYPMNIKDQNIAINLSDDIAYLINEDLFNALNDFAAPYMYFGAHPGDGSDFGFWHRELSFEEDNEVVVANDNLPSYIAVVNDHGNITMYSIDSEGQLWEEWSIV